MPSSFGIWDFLSGRAATELRPAFPPVPSVSLTLPGLGRVETKKKNPKGGVSMARRRKRTRRHGRRSHRVRRIRRHSRRRKR